MKRGHKIVSLLIACAMVTPLAFSNVNTVEAANKFEGQETKYYKLCSSKTLTRSNQNTCKEFNKYLKTKSASLKSEISSKQSSVDSAKLSISDAADKINSLNSQINEATQKIAYMNTAITNAENNLNEKKALLKDRIYSMQSQMNSNAYVDYLFNASSFSDFFSRAATLKDLTSYETDLMNEIKEEQKQLEIQKQTLVDTQTALNAQKSQAEELQKSLVAKLEAEQKALQDKQSDLSDNESNIGTIAQNLVELSKASDESKVSGVTHATPNKNNSSSSNSGSSNNGGSSNNSGSSNNGGGNTIPTPTPSPDQSSRGLAIANKALTRQGYMYSWGGCHSMSQIANPNWTKFDCSGLVNWSHYQAGVNIGSNTTKTLCGVGTQVDRGSMQAGDIILFSSNGSYSGVHHVGIYIGGNRMVHAPSSGKPVQVASLGNGYWQREFYQARRCY
ncbi:C40 family peptidase [Catenibacterium mitsuokai]|uniref:C40 family peptidase n=1 Tax=Catenibacterium mitsuokai TaxID=100886 RepID=UPI001D014822|nr:C40 family peptidase [Catenibacterium mitsuokai]MCB5428623.1 NlpC/P60 family protein [Catenibacterium mitsuokai]